MQKPVIIKIILWVFGFTFCLAGLIFLQVHFFLFKYCFNDTINTIVSMLNVVIYAAVMYAVISRVWVVGSGC